MISWRLSPEQRGERGRSLRAVKDVLLLDPDHGQPAPPGVERVTPAGLFLLLGEQSQPGLQPLFARHKLGESHHDLLNRGEASDKVLSRVRLASHAKITGPEGTT
jgi:hypothetical protein